jgi:hypothetical protein
VEPAVVELVLEEAEQEVVPVLAGVWEMDTIATRSGAARASSHERRK